MGDMMDGGMMEGAMTDRMFLRMMVAHHHATAIAEDALVDAEHEERKTLAQEIGNGQSPEIAEMEGIFATGTTRRRTTMVPTTCGR